jgi:protein SCO1/2
MKKDGLVLFGAVVGSIVAIVIIGLGLSIAPNLLAPPVLTPTPGGLMIENAHTARDFELTNQLGKPTRLSDFRGKVVLLFFGYTHCPDVCPLSLSEFKKVKAKLAEASPALADKVAFVMVSVDGERDTPEVMRNYVSTFDASFIGLTGASDHVAAIGLDYGVKFEKQKPAGTQASYLIAHTSFTYLIDPQGSWRVAYPFQTPTDMVAGDVARFATK